MHFIEILLDILFPGAKILLDAERMYGREHVQTQHAYLACDK